MAAMPLHRTLSRAKHQAHAIRHWDAQQEALMRRALESRARQTAASEPRTEATSPK